MKRILAVFLLVLLLTAAVPATSFAATPNGSTTMYHVATNGGNLYLRAGAGTNYRILASLPNGTALTRSSTKGNWYKVKTMNGLVGWVSRTYVRKLAYANVNTRESGLNVRAGRGTGYRVLYSIPHGTKHVPVKYINGNWAYVSWGDRGYGWASRSYLRWTR